MFLRKFAEFDHNRFNVNYVLGGAGGTCDPDSYVGFKGKLYRGYYQNRITDMTDPVYNGAECSNAILGRNRDYLGWTKLSPSMPCQPFMQEHMPQKFIYDDQALTCIFGIQHIKCNLQR